MEHGPHRLCGDKGTIENAQMIAQENSPRKTKLYDHRCQGVALSDIEPIQLYLALVESLQGH